MRLLAPKTKQSYLFLAPPHSGLGKAVAGIYPGVQCTETLLLPPPPYRHYRHCPSPDHSPLFALNRQPVKRVCDRRRNKWLLDRMAACRSWICFPLLQESCVYGVCAFVLRCFSCSHTVLPKEHSLGVIFFLLTFLMLMLYFLQFPVFLFCLPPCHMYVVYVWTG